MPDTSRPSDRRRVIERKWQRTNKILPGSGDTMRNWQARGRGGGRDRDRCCDPLWRRHCVAAGAEGRKAAAGDVEISRACLRSARSYDDPGETPGFRRVPTRGNPFAFPPTSC